MELWHVVILALVQALTEFLPVSSSGHLGLVGFFLGWPYQGLTFDLALHFGTLTAVLIYYRRDLWRMATALLSRGQSAIDVQHRRLGWGLVIATVPALIAGVAMGDALAVSLRSPLLIAINLIVFGVVLGVVDRHARQSRDVWSVGLRDALLIGLAQVLALIPGVSRSGITMTAGLALGLSRVDAARYTFLMSVPVTAAASAHGLLTLLRSGESIDVWAFVIGAAIAAIAGLGCIHFLLGFLRRAGMLPFVVYRIALGIAVLVMLAVAA
ncbi:MAG: undecaprenyl-diphosphate phosphatase [Pseudomonadota bacterium]|nr:undecaprenyl-diphosphate phosphatase [Pseudomonadota bacterium]